MIAKGEIAGIGLACVAATAIGTSFIASAELVHYPFLIGQALRYAVAALVLTGYAWVARVRPTRPKGREWLRLAVLAATGQVGFNLAVLAALRSAEPAAVGVVVGCTPVALALAEPMLGRRRLSGRVVTAALIVTAGAAVVQGFGRTDVPGFLYALVALLGEAAFSLLAVPLLPRIGPTAVSLYSGGLAAVELMALAAVLERGTAWRMPTLPETISLAYLAVVVTAAGFVCWYTALRRLGPARSGIFLGLIPVTAAICTPLFSTNQFGVAQVAGCCLVGVGVVVSVSAKQH